MARDDVLARALPLGEQWQVYGTDAARGVTVEGLKLGADDFGPRDASWTFQRDPSIAFGDLSASTPVEFEIGGSKLWSGRTKESPSSEINRQISVSAEGWQFHLDDDDYLQQYVQPSLSAWQDIRSNMYANLGLWLASNPVNVDSTGITLTVTGNATVSDAAHSAVMQDCGPLSQNWAQGMVVSWAHSGNDPSTTLVLMLSNVSPGAITNAGATSIVTLTGGTTGATFLSFGGSYRYVALGIVSNTGTPRTITADTYIKILAATLYTDSTKFGSGVGSILKASDVIKNAKTYAPLLDADTSLIAGTAFNIPSWAPTNFDTPRNIMQAANAYHSYQLRVRADRKLEFRARPTYPLLTAVGGTLDTASLGSIDQVYNRCVGQTTAQDGSTIYTDQQSSGSIPSKRGYFRTNLLNTNMSLTQAALDQIAATFVSSHGRMPFKGTLTVVGTGAVEMTVGGAKVAAWELLQYVGEMIHFPNQVDPDTGAKGRDGRISAVSYDHDSRTASISIDSQRSNFEALLARLQVVTGQVA